MRVREWLAKRNVNPKIFLSIIIVLAFGFICGIFATGQFEKTALMITVNPSSKVKQFINTFTLNYWYFFLLWFVAFIPLGFILAYFILFFKSFILGVTLSLIIKAEALFGTYSFFKLLIWQFLILLPLLIFLAQRVLVITLTLIPRKGMVSKPQLNLSAYLNTLLIITLGIAIFSFLVSLSSLSIATIK